MKRIFFKLLPVFLLLITPGWAGAVENQAPPSPPLQIKRVAVVPFLIGRPEGDMEEAFKNTLGCTIEQFCPRESSVAAGADEILTRLVRREVKRRFSAETLPMEETVEAYVTTALDEKNDTLRLLAQKVGKALNADKVFVGTVWRYREKGVLAAKPAEGASVAFWVSMVDVDTGRRLWRGVFDKTQQPLSEDLRGTGDFFKMGGKWLSAEELARFGVEKVFKTFPY